VAGRCGAGTCRRESRHEPPAAAVRAAARLGAGSPRGARARVVYDGRRDPLPRGMRSTDRPTQVLYHVLGYAVDLQVNREASGSEVAEARMVLVGQIVDRYDPARRLAAVAVTLRHSAGGLFTRWSLAAVV